MKWLTAFVIFLLKYIFFLLLNFVKILQCNLKLSWVFIRVVVGVK